MSTAVRPLKASPESGPNLAAAGVGFSEIRVKGKTLFVPSVLINGKTVTARGRLLKVAEVRHEDLVEGDTLVDPEPFISQLKNSNFKADIFTFGQRLPDKDPKYQYLTEWENVAAVPITTFAYWWKDLAEHSIRKSVNKATRLGVITKIVEFSDEFVQATCSIYNETPVRQGKTFWHYGKTFETIKHELGNYLDRSVFVGAYFQDELIGFMKITWVGATGTITQILSKKTHFDKRPNNALIAKAIETCELRGKSHFIYGSFVYFDANSSLTEFKRRNGFKSVLRFPDTTYHSR